MEVTCKSENCIDFYENPSKFTGDSSICMLHISEAHSAKMERLICSRIEDIVSKDKFNHGLFCSTQLNTNW